MLLKRFPVARCSRCLIAASCVCSYILHGPWGRIAFVGARSAAHEGVAQHQPSSHVWTTGRRVSASRMGPCVQRKRVFRAKLLAAQAINGTSSKSDRMDATGDRDTTAFYEFESSDLWDRPIVSNADGGTVLLVLAGLASLANLYSWATSFQFASEKGELAAGMVATSFFVNMLAYICVIGVLVWAAREFVIGTRDDSDNNSNWWEEFWTSEYLNEPVAFDFQVVALGIIGGIIALLATSALLTRGTQAIGDQIFEDSPVLSLRRQS
eukprot:TRINITY_DN103989_c0_g1_i1.p1 TRINITY_DN103989_c0_g1~~TRINITY_DN103989_c0_g1_i1.p1  ORF type:complete len:267 (-),score=19.21 TRINITY_DN103989_c0_g1_i1:128-928(-)